MQNLHELSNFKLSFSRDSLKCALIENVRIFVDEFDMLEHEQLKIGMNFPDIQYHKESTFFYDFFPLFKMSKLINHYFAYVSVSLD